MRFMVLVKANKESEAGVLPAESELNAMGKFNEELVKAGVMLAGEGLQASSKGARVRFGKGKPVVIDGPFAETKELVAGYTIIQVDSHEEALKWVERWPVEDADGEVELELRELYEADDFGEEFTPAIERQGELLRERQGHAR